MEAIPTLLHEFPKGEYLGQLPRLIRRLEFLRNLFLVAEGGEW